MRRFSLGAYLGLAAEDDDDAEGAMDRKPQPKQASSSFSKPTTEGKSKWT